MPRYEYRCEANGRTLEVEHRMDERLATWRELCQAAGIDPGDTPGDASVDKLVSLTRVGTKEAGWTPPPGPGPCGPSCGCHPG